MSQATAPHRPPVEHHHPPEAPRRPWTVLVLVAVAQFMVILDVTVVNVALPSIGAGLGFSAGDLPWVISAYVLLTGGLMLLGGRLADLAGRRTVFASGVAVFAAASLASGLAWSPGALIAARALQGAGAALLLPSALSIVTTTYDGAQRAVALGLWGAMGSAGAAAGVLLGGVLTTLLGWRWIFLVNVPVGAVVLVAARRFVPLGPRHDRGPVDVLGAVTLVTGLGALVSAIQGTATHGWSSTRTWVLLAAAGALLAAFSQVERRAPRPLVAPSTWRVRSLAAGATVMLGATGLLVGAFFLNTLQLQDAMGASALEAGLAFLPLAVVILVGAHVASHLASRAGTRPFLVGGLVLVAAGALLLTAAPASASYLTDLLPGFVVLGLGIGLTFVSVSIAAMADVPHERAGVASGLMTTSHELGAALGVAVMAAVAGYGDGFRVTAAIAAGLAVLAAVAVPSVRPPSGATAPMH
jgi:EmrB/QacA subfamily drug resistance transporter